jgi:IclR family pca regulon transcriptional regulator
VAAPIHDRSDRVIAAINLAVHAARVSVEEIRSSLLGPLLQTAADIERDLGAGGPLR